MDVRENLERERENSNGGLLLGLPTGGGAHHHDRNVEVKPKVSLKTAGTAAVGWAGGRNWAACSWEAAAAGSFSLRSGKA